MGCLDGGWLAGSLAERRDAHHRLIGYSLLAAHAVVLGMLGWSVWEPGQGDARGTTEGADSLLAAGTVYGAPRPRFRPAGPCTQPLPMTQVMGDGDHGALRGFVASLLAKGPD
jgi:hypothetical protein